MVSLDIVPLEVTVSKMRSRKLSEDLLYTDHFADGSGLSDYLTMEDLSLIFRPCPATVQ